MGEVPALEERSSPAASWRSELVAYRTVLGSRLAAQRSHRASFAIDLAAAALITLIEFAEVWVIFHNVQVLGGLSLSGIMVVFGLASSSFALADLLVGHCDRIPTYLRAGTLEVFYLRPQPVLMQLITSDISLRRIAQVATGGSILGVGLSIADIAWSWDKVLLLVIALPAATAIYCALFISAAGLQFFLISGAEVTNAYVYGGRYASVQPASIWPRSMVLVFGFALPLIFTGYLPTLWLLGMEGQGPLFAWLAWLAPVAALWIWGVALLCWRLGIRHYQGAGG